MHPKKRSRFVTELISSWLRGDEDKMLCGDMTVPPHSAKKKKRKSRKWIKLKRAPFSTSPFYIDYHDIAVREPSTLQVRNFRLDYRMPWIEAHNLIELLKRNGHWFRGGLTSITW